MENEILEKKINILTQEILEIKHLIKTQFNNEVPKLKKRSPKNNQDYLEKKLFIKSKLQFVDKKIELNGEFPPTFGRSLDSIVDFLNSYGMFEFNKISLSKLLISIYGERVKYTLIKGTKRHTYYKIIHK